MTPAARVQSSIEILDTILAGMSSEQALIRWARSNRFAGSKDRAAVRDLVFSAIRCRSSFAFLGGSLSGRGLMVGSLISVGSDVQDVFNGIGYGPVELTDDEKQALQSLEDIPVETSVDLQDWVWEKFQKDLGDVAQATAMALRHRAALFLRVNAKKCSLPKAIALLKDDEIEATPHPLSDTALEVIQNPRRVAQSQAYKAGFVELQDAASQAVCDFLNLPSEGAILDYCAGGGGKSLAMAAKTNARIVAHDANPDRLKDLPVRAKRASISLEIIDNISDNAQFDLVLCDVPCTGSGSWRRSPDAKWSLSPVALAALNTTQSEIIEKASTLVKPKGELAYATCSVFACENRERIDAFIANNPKWSLIEDKTFLPQDGGDGFYVARLTRA